MSDRIYSIICTRIFEQDRWTLRLNPFSENFFYDNKESVWIGVWRYDVCFDWLRVKRTRKTSWNIIISAFETNEHAQNAPNIKV